MEHRHHTRQPTYYDTLLYRRGLPVATGRLRDASRGGVFVQTDYPGLEEHQRLEFECCIGSDRLHMVAHVLRRERDGIALEVDDRDPASSLDLGTLLALSAEWRVPRALRAANLEAASRQGPRLAGQSKTKALEVIYY